MLGDNHQVSVDIGALPDMVQCVCVVFSAPLTQMQHIGMLQSICCRLLLDPRGNAITRQTPDGERVNEPGTELCRFSMGSSTLERKNAVALARLERVVSLRADGTRQHDGWRFVAMGNPIQGSTSRVAAQQVTFLAEPRLLLLQPRRRRGADGQYSNDDEEERAKIAAAERGLPKDEKRSY